MADEASRLASYQARNRAAMDVRRLCEAMLGLRAAALTAHDELEFGGNWLAAKQRIEEAVRAGDTVLAAAWPEELGPQFFGDPFPTPAAKGAIER